MRAHNPPERVTREYARLSGDYDSKWSFYIDATMRETLARLDLHRQDQLLDLGCGTGALLARLSAIHPAIRLSGVDPVPEMLAIARRKLSPAIGLYQSWAEQLPFPDQQFDVVVSCNMFHYIDRPLDALGEVRRVLRPGGRLVITDWCGDYLSCRIVDRYQRLLGRAHAQVYRQYECTRLATEADYATAAIDRYKINWLWGLMTARFIKTAAPEGTPGPRY